MVTESPCGAFTYDSVRDWGVTRTALGIACPWPVLCDEFFRQGLPCPATSVIHFKTISLVGPKLFAVSLDNFKVFYHDGYQWHQYRTARNVRLGRMKDFMEFFHDNDGDNNSEDCSQQDNNGFDRDDDLGQQVKDLGFNGISTYKMNQAILYYCLIRILFFNQLRMYSLESGSFIR